MRMSDHPYSYRSPKLETRATSHGLGNFARETVYKGELLAIWGGQVLKKDAFMQQTEYMRNISIQVGDDLFLVPIKLEDADYFNHSCDPNAGLNGQHTLIAMREIMPGEEICFDYAMCDSVPYDEFECECGAANCRGKVTGNDWKITALWERYDGYFSPYLQRKIDATCVLQSVMLQQEIIVVEQSS